jgi:hypothetical protein
MADFGIGSAEHFGSTITLTISSYYNQQLLLLLLLF